MKALVAAEVARAVAAFHGTARDERVWAEIAWRVGAEAFSKAIDEKHSVDDCDGTEQLRSPAAAFQALLNVRFPKPVRTRATGKTPVVPETGGAA